MWWGVSGRVFVDCAQSKLFPVESSVDNCIFNKDSLYSKEFVGEFHMDEDCCSITIGFACRKSICLVGEKVG